MNCFLLTYSSYDNNGHFEIKLYGRGDNVKPVEITITNYRPLFFIPGKTSSEFTKYCTERKTMPLKSFKNTPLDCCYFNTYSSCLKCAGIMNNAGVELYESDIDPVQRYLMERRIKGGFIINGKISENKYSIISRNPKLSGNDYSPKLATAVVYICLNKKRDEILRISCVSDRHKRPLLFSTGSRYSGKDVITCKNEKDLLTKFISFIKNDSPDLIAGWDGINHDIQLLISRADLLNVRSFSQNKDKTISDTPKNQEHASIRNFFGSRPIMDISHMLDRSCYKTRGNLLRNTAVDLLGEKIVNNDHEKSLLNSSLVIKNIFDKNDILSNAVERTKLSGRPINSRGESISIFDFLYLPLLHKRGHIADSRKHNQFPDKSLTGGFVIEPTAGIYHNVILLDFKSLYPTIMLSFNIDPLGYYIKDDSFLIRTPEGVSFSREESILASILKDLLKVREKAKTEYNPALSKAVKLIMNSFYGVLGSSASRYFSNDIAGAITSTGRHILKASRDYIEKSTGLSVIYGDTDSLFVHAGENPQDSIRNIGLKIVSDTNKWLSDYLYHNYNAQSFLQLEFEMHFRYFFIPPLRNSSQGSKKKYCGAVDNNGGLELIFKGMEYSRTDWTELSREFQYELMRRYFTGNNITDYILSTTDNLIKGKLDSKLVYTKGISKSLSDYSETVPQHIQAAIKLNKGDIDTVSYVITKNGPEPVEKASSPLNYEHYVQSQLKPVADQVLAMSDTNFDSLTSGQTDLFS